ncbi:hypothetical protein GF385_04760 [Candidatus Dependentiae bacterium]|nr:hypothetical protein [Candidatus Dependentiae bacterium]
MKKRKSSFFLQRILHKFFVLFFLLLFYSSNNLKTNDLIIIETTKVDGYNNVKNSKDLTKSRKKQTALHLIYQKAKEKLDSLLKPEKNSKKDIQYRAVDLPSNDAKIAQYSNISNIDLADSTGNIILYKTTADNFSISSSGSLNLTLEQGSTLKLKDEAVTLESGDVINIVGKNNFIEVPNTFNINGSLLFDTNSQLTIKLTTDDAQVVIADGVVIDLESNTEFKISGDGLITFGDGSTINLKGNTSSPKLYPSFIIDAFATLSIDNSATGIIKGIGKIIVQDGGVIDVRGYGYNKSLKVGISTTDDIDFYIKGKAMIRLEGGDSSYRTAGYSYAPPTGNYGNISFGTGKFSLTLKQGGILYIGDGGWLEFGSVLSEPTSSGHLKKIDFGPDGNFYLNTGGLLSLADNDFVGSSQLTTIWISDDAKLLGDKGGLVEYIARAPNPGFNYQGFEGTFQSGNFAFKNTSGLIPKDIAKKLINQNTTLVTAILYTDSTGTKKIRLKNGAKINFVTTDTIVGEDSSGNVLARSDRGRRVIYKLNGTRV